MARSENASCRSLTLQVGCVIVFVSEARLYVYSQDERRMNVKVRSKVMTHVVLASCSANATELKEFIDRHKVHVALKLESLVNVK